MPHELAISASPMIGQPWTSHPAFGLTKINTEFAYQDLTNPISAMSEAAIWLRENGIGERGERAL